MKIKTVLAFVAIIAVIDGAAAILAGGLGLIAVICAK